MRIALGALLLTAALLPACGGSNDGGVNVTLRFDDSISEPMLVQVNQLVVHTSGDEMGSYTIPVGNLQRVERFVYRQAKGTHVLAFTVDALVNGGVVGTGTSSTLEISGGQTSTAILIYGQAATDLGADQLMLSDLTQHDLENADLTPPPLAPRFVSISNAEAQSSAADPAVPLPSGTLPGDFMFATVYMFDQNTTVAAPSGWNLYQTIPGPATSFRVTWLYRIADGTEAATVTFPRTPATQTVFVSVASYRGVLASAPIDLGQASILPSNPYLLPGITTTHPYTLLVANWISDSGTDPSWTAPTSMSSHRLDTMLIADQPFDSVGATGSFSATCTASVTNGVAGLLMALRSQ
jgi:hypothetical protein